MSKKTWSPDIFDSLFQKNPDPWDFEKSLYEQEKLARLLSCLPQEPINFAVELGCAVGWEQRRLRPVARMFWR